MIPLEHYLEADRSPVFGGGSLRARQARFFAAGASVSAGSESVWKALDTESAKFRQVATDVIVEATGDPA
jgi:hypothetical protein